MKKLELRTSRATLNLLTGNVLYKGANESVKTKAMELVKYLFIKQNIPEATYTKIEGLEAIMQVMPLF
jgi:hypothetical protein